MAIEIGGGITIGGGISVVATPPAAAMISGTMTMGYSGMGNEWAANRGSFSFTPSGIFNDMSYIVGGDITKVYLIVGTVGLYTISGTGINGNPTLSVTIDGVTQTTSDLFDGGAAIVWNFTGNPFGLDNSNPHTVSMSPA